MNKRGEKMDQNYKRKRTEQCLRQRLSELYKARTELDSTRTSSQRNAISGMCWRKKKPLDHKPRILNENYSYGGIKNMIQVKANMKIRLALKGKDIP